MAKPSRNGFPFAKTVTILASIFGIGLGLCGLNYVLLFAFGMGRGGSARLAQFASPMFGILGFIELVVMLISGPLLVLTVICWVISEILGVGHGSEPQRLFDNSESESEQDDDRRRQ